ncbi:facilitated trehalose transporter Tret1-like [Hyposmocoma kahamanoa]|uniref:facilitated trehalose transporter Tret1-like n=1 Tax=Hyposmocoma kahamanoa TaxID=1477025 RepID=UPI000E6D9098|nr:facilitated trehalose transporter Tret1-like [Hyposmocoma kahamanoa]
MEQAKVWVVSGVLVNMMAQGVVVSYAFSLMPALQGPDSPVEVDLHTASWIASCVGLASIPGHFLASAFMDRWGRKVTNMLLILPGMIGWTSIYYASSVAAFLIGRILCGITVGATPGLGAIVIGECSSPNLRGVFLNLKSVSVCLGSTIVHLLGNYVSWRTIALLAIIPHILALLNVMTWHETPAFLAFKKEFGKAEKSFFWLRGRDDNSKKELNELIRSQMNKVDNQKVTTLTENIVDFFKKFKRRDFLVPILILISGTLLLEVSGRHFFPAYALDIIGEVTVFGSSMAVLLSILYFLVPETKDRTLQEIEEYFNYGRFKDDEQFEKGDEASKVVMLPETEVKL